MSSAATIERDYAALRPSVRGGSDHASSRRRFLEQTWAAFGDPSPTPDRRTVSWIGFYERDPSDASQMLLLDREPKPACSPIGLHGMCGRGMIDAAAIIIDNVRTLGPNYIACDPRDQSELVIPVFGADGVCTGVLDVDSYAIGAFREHDVHGLHELLVAFGLTSRTNLPRIVRL